MKCFFTGMLAMMLFAACKNSRQQPQTSVSQAVQNQPASIGDSAEIRTVITSFYNWYNDHFRSFFRFNLYQGTGPDLAPPYRINWDEVKKYHQFIRDSVPQLGENFVLHQNNFFKECDSAFAADKESEIPYGFDYDWYTNSQEEPQYLVAYINQPGRWFILQLGDDAWVEILANMEYDGIKKEEAILKLEMKKENGSWKIARIGTE